MRAIFLTVLLTAGLGACAAGAKSPTAAGKAHTPPSGAFTVVTTRRASGVAGGPAEAAATERIGATVSFGKTLTWWDGTRCKAWAAEPMNERVLPLDDPLLSDTQVPPLDGPVSAGDRRLNVGWSLACDGRPLGVLLQVDERVLVTPTRSGVTNVILEKPLSPDETLAFQKQLKDMKFYSGTPSRDWDEDSLAAVASYAEYRGAKYRFARPAITENLLDGLDILAFQIPSDNPDDWVELKTVYSGDVAAHFWGGKMQLVPLEYGVKQLRFTFKGDPKTYVFKPEGTLYATDWTFDIFSPDGDYVLLLQDRFGPYHLVPLADLKAYLKGEKKPAHVIGRLPKDGEPAGVHSDAHWLSPYELEYTVTCCGTAEVRRYNIRFPDYKPKETPDTLLDYRPALGAEVASLPAARLENLKALLKAHEEWSGKAAKAPGQWEEGNIPLGADPKEYVPSDAELMAAELCSRIRHVISEAGAAELPEALRTQKIRSRRIECMEFTFRHVDVMGSGRFFYASPPKRMVIRLRSAG